MKNKEMVQRLKAAGEYQIKAIRALFPEGMGAHLDVIEKELKMMAAEAVAELSKEFNKNDVCGDGQNREQPPKVKKVDIV